MTSEISPPRPDRSVDVSLIGLLAMGLVFRLTLLRVHGREHDITIFAQWARVLATFGTHGLYDHLEPWSRTAINYPPGYALMLLGVVRTYALFAPGGNEGALSVLLKLPAIAADLACVVLIYAIVRHYATARQAIWSAAIATFGPWTWPLSAIMGQVDSVCACLLLLSLLLAMQDRFAYAWLALAAGTLVKPFPILVAPVLIAMSLRRAETRRRVLLGPLLALALAYVVALPFAPSAFPPSTFAWLAREYGSGQGLFPSTSFFAANIWTLFAAPTEDTQRFLGVSLQTYGWLLLFAAEILVVLALVQRVRNASDSATRMRSQTVAWFLIMLGVFVVTTRMHERYLAYALAIAPALWPLGARHRAAVITLAVTFTANTLLAYLLAARGPEGFDTLAVHAISLANVLVLTCGLIAYGRAAATDIPRNKI